MEGMTAEEYNGMCYCKNSMLELPSVDQIGDAYHNSTIKRAYCRDKNTQEQQCTVCGESGMTRTADLMDQPISRLSDAFTKDHALILAETTSSPEEENEHQVSGQSHEEHRPAPADVNSQLRGSTEEKVQRRAPPVQQRTEPRIPSATFGLAWTKQLTTNRSVSGSRQKRSTLLLQRTGIHRRRTNRMIPVTSTSESGVLQATILTAKIENGNESEGSGTDGDDVKVD